MELLPCYIPVKWNEVLATQSFLHTTLRSWVWFSLKIPGKHQRSPWQIALVSQVGSASRAVFCNGPAVASWLQSS